MGIKPPDFNVVINKIDEAIKIIKEIEKIDQLDPKLAKEKFLKYVNFVRETIAMADGFPSVLGLSAADRELIEEGIETFFNKIWQNFETKDLAVKHFLVKDEGFFYLNLFQTDLVILEATSRILLNLDWKLNLLDVFVLIHLYQQKFESFCLFLKPFVEKYFEDQVEDDQEKFHSRIFNQFLKWLEPNLQKFYKKNIDKTLRDAAAHASFTVNMNTTTITIRKMRKNAPPKLIEYSFSKFLKEFNQLNEITRYLYKVWWHYLCDFLEKTIDNDSLIKDSEIKHCLDSVNLEYCIRDFEEFKVSLINLNRRKKIRSLYSKGYFNN